MLLLIVQKFTDGSTIETGVPISPCNVLRWIYECRNSNEIYLTIDLGLARSIKLMGTSAIQTRDVLTRQFSTVHRVETD